jgi:hypothetical protein
MIAASDAIRGGAIGTIVAAMFASQFVAARFTGRRRR